MFFGIILLVGITLFLIYKLLKIFRPQLSNLNLIIEFSVISFYLFSICSFIIFNLDTRPFHVAIDPLNNKYETFAQKHSLVLYLFYFTFLVSAISIWLKNSKLPPLISVIFHSFLLIQTVISVFSIIQIVGRGEDDFHFSGEDPIEMALGYIIFILNIVISLLLFSRTINQEISISDRRNFKNSVLNNLNLFLSQSKNYYPAIIIFAFPIYLLVTLILILFGQDYNSMTKAFTETTTWGFSQQEHPPYLDHNGHYLCTVAACGNPKNVKPLFVGKRHHNPIIVNRQLQIANAFEELIEINFPKIHQIIRKNYDQYGYNLSRKINTKFYSDLTYYLMKPLEFFFLIFIYSFSLKPEILIQKQYQNA